MRSSVRGFATTCGLILFLAAVSATAGPLAAAKPSDVVTLSTSGATCAGSGLLLDTRIASDGTAVPFVIPAKRVLVVTELQWGVIAVPASQTFDFLLFLKTPPATTLPLVTSSAVADATGHAGATTQVANAVVKPGPLFCAIDFPGSSALILVRGFLAKDK